MKLRQLLLFLGTAIACSACHTSFRQSPVPDSDFQLSVEALDTSFHVKLENTSPDNICLFIGDWPIVGIGGILPGVSGGNYVGDTSAAPYVEIGEQKFKYIKTASHLGHSSEQLKIEPWKIIETTLPYADFFSLPENLMDAELHYPITPLSCR